MRQTLSWAALMLVSCSSAAIASTQPIAAFDYVSYSGTPDAEHADVSADSYANPVLPGFAPDPSIVRRGDDYYLVTSTFSFFPGLPIYHSRDLVNWRQIGNALDRPSQMDLGNLGVTRALFAPTIQYHDGLFYILNTCVECGDNFILTAKDPAGPWSDPIWLPFGGIDPSLFVDEDGRGWISYNDAPPGPPEYEGHRALWLQEIDMKTLKLMPTRTLPRDKGVVATDKPIWAEGPHIYKVGDYYYLTAAEGGTADQHSQTIYRSNKVDGPYEPGPVNPIMTQRDLPENRPWPVQATGHADFVQIPDGSWWAVFLATRPYAGQQTNIGRETFLLPVNWTDGWPNIVPAGTAIAPTNKRPNLPLGEGDQLTQWRDDFDHDTLAMDWMMLRTPKGAEWWQPSENGQLLLAARPIAAGSLDQPSFIGKRLRHHDGIFETRVSFAPNAAGDRAGLLVLTDENHFYFYGVEQLADGDHALVIRRRGDAAEDTHGEIVAYQKFAGKAPGSLDLKIHLVRDKATFAWKADGIADWQVTAANMDSSVLATIGAGLFTGAVVGPHAARAEAE
jgi:xylan 1,4-beta-xylosidase